MDITIRNLQKRRPLNPTQIVKIVRKILRHEKIKDANLSIVFVTDQKIRSINKKYLYHDYATDVLSFDLSDKTASFRKTKKKNSLEGEIIISTMTTLRNAKLYKTTFDRELILYIIHGILHLLGYDDYSTEDIKSMRAKEQEISKFLEF